MAQISFTLSGGFWPGSLPLFHGIERLAIVELSCQGAAFVLFAIVAAATWVGRRLFGVERVV